MPIVKINQITPKKLTIGALNAGDGFTSDQSPIKPEGKHLNLAGRAPFSYADVMMRVSDAVKYVLHKEPYSLLAPVEQPVVVNPNQVRAVRMSDGQIFVFERNATVGKVFNLSVIADEREE